MPSPAHRATGACGASGATDTVPSPAHRATGATDTVPSPAHRATGAARSPGLRDVARLMLQVLRGLATLWLATAVALTGCVALGRVIGWRAAVVISGSMQPAVQAGDLVLADPAAATGVRTGHIVLVRRPDLPGRLLTHRVARVLPNGSVVTRGDANATDDAAPVPRRDVVGVVRLVVPAIGRPALLLRRHSPGDLLFTGLLLASALLVATQPQTSGTRRPARRPRRAGTDLPSRRH